MNSSANTLPRHTGDGCRRLPLGLLVALGLLCGAGLVCPAQEPADAPGKSDPGLTADQLEARISELAGAQNLDDGVRERATKLYKQVLDQLQSAAERAKQVAQWNHEREGAADRAKQLQKQLDGSDTQQPPAIPSDASLTDIEQMLAEQRDRLTKAEKSLEDAKQEAAQRVARRAEVPKQTQEAQDRLAEVEAALAAPPAPGQASQVAQAQNALNRATKQAIEAELKSLSAELPTYDATARALQLQQSLAEKQVSQARNGLDELAKTADERRKQEARRQAQRARQTAALVHPALEQIAQTNLELTRLRTGPEGKPQEGLNARIARATSKLQEVDDELQTLSDIKSDLQEKLSIEGISSYLGPLMLEQRSNLPSTADLRREIAQRQDEIALVRFHLTDVRQRLRGLENLDDEVDDLTAKLGPDISESKEQEILDTGRKLLDQQRKLLGDVRDEYSNYFNLLNNLNAKQQELVANTAALEKTLERHLLWTRTTPNLGPADAHPGYLALRWLLNGQNWREVWLDIRDSIQRNPEQLALPLFMIVVVVLRWPLARRLRLLGERVGHDARGALRIHVVGIGRHGATRHGVAGRGSDHGLVAVLQPAGRTFHARRRHGAGDHGVGTDAGHVSATDVAPGRPVRGALSLAVVGRSPDSRHLRGAVMLLAPIVFVVAVLDWDGTPEWQNSLGRALFVVGMVAAGVLIDRMFRTPENKIAGAAQSTPTRWQQILRVLAVAAPLLLAALAFAGYYPTALELTTHVYETICLFIGLSVFQGMALRWLRLVRGRFALSRVEEPQPPADESATGAEGEPAEPQIDLATVNQQTRQLLRGCLVLILTVGTWLIWVDVLPLTAWLDQPMWQAAQQVTRTIDDANAGQAVQEVTEFRVITVGHLLLAVLIGVATFVAARNIPGLLQVSIPQSVPLDEGARFALITVIRYVLLAVGVTIAFGTIGIGWSHIQWLVAALSVGIGFGLQELVANFICGLIMLFERPVRVGDTVTVDDITGTVTRIKMCATTIRSWDQQEYLVPNKELITGRVLNWTLTDNTNRITIQVGVSYSSDPEKVRRILFEIVRRNRNILRDPAPLITFESFGDSSLNFTMRVYLQGLDKRLPTMDYLHSEILNRFRKEGIEIPFPQRDLNVRKFDHPIEFTRADAEKPASDGSNDHAKP